MNQVLTSSLLFGAQKTIDTLHYCMLHPFPATHSNANAILCREFHHKRRGIFLILVERSHTTHHLHAAVATTGAHGHRENVSCKNTSITASLHLVRLSVSEERKRAKNSSLCSASYWGTLLLASCPLQALGLDRLHSSSIYIILHAASKSSCKFILNVAHLIWLLGT